MRPEHLFPSHPPRRGGRPGRRSRYAVLLIAATACTGSHGGLEPRHIAGCYYFERDAAAQQLRLPWGIRLQAAPLEGWPAMEARNEAYQATTLTGRTEEDNPFAFWAPVPPDSLEVGYPGGGGILLRLTFDDRDLHGTARPLGDVLRPGEEPGLRSARPVRLMWARCPTD